jgi:hypothetical protein
VSEQSRKSRVTAASRGARRRDGRAASLEAGQRALSEGRFDDARRAFEAALRRAETPEAHEGLAHATMWHDTGAGVAPLERAHRLYLERGDERGAGRAAFWLASSYLSLGQPVVASGWAERAMEVTRFR